MDIFLIKALNYKQGNTTFALRFESKANEGIGLKQIASQNMGSKKLQKNFFRNQDLGKQMMYICIRFEKQGKKEKKKEAETRKKVLKKDEKSFADRH